jgi:hypothetical protein
VPPEPNPHEFVFEIDLAIRTQVIQKLEISPKLLLTRDVGPPLKGVYVLYWKGNLVYAGKALFTTLRKRLNEHHDKIAGRRGISPKDMTCRFLTIGSDWFVRAAEDALITNYHPIWNLSGFGSHVPGRGRPGIRVSKWDKDFPSKID